MKKIIAVALTALAVQACADNQSIAGIHAQVGAKNLKSRSDTIDVGEGTTKQFTRTPDHRQFQLETGLLKLEPVALVGCGLARVAGEVLGSILSGAWAHGADEHAPGGILDVSQPDDTYVDLGEVGAAPGTYCGLRIALVPVTAAPGEGEVDMRGHAVYLTQCDYYDSPADTAKHYCFTLKLAESAQSVVLDLPEAVTLGPDRRHLGLAVVVHYDRWMDRGADDDAFSALDGYAPIINNPPCNTADTATYDAAACRTARDDFKAGLQDNAELKARVLDNIIASLSVEIAESD
ncbi:hypothetical protein AAG565_05835 [Fontimonas sp. SYSU GA230001]|uniref:hypothetical protein n=1 Tax=Fontimonas sp. SYSU GA230001 TaxID=3142450 RepID=UPI0032B40384